ncbi:tripartite tricarboxylate transporter TctB family protein [Tabrizicola sp.]|uniref:tripartite tricarboxylate transporter TctB family protein n=1 Tax=Tabrizicola sp. TaxID=2005166 RepID=UPI001A481230|nr:tripartite tricarboxylate transporter TctB family protein [Tabrizicola sp.]MBL9073287.1 tripartite tricarboxylate transporter TctB family protein [Tabrizicola sp.]
MSEGFPLERRPRWAAFVIAAGLAGLAAMILWDASGLKQDGGYAGVGPADVPRIIAYGLLLLAGLTVISGLKGDLPRPPPQAPAPVLWIMGGLIGQLLLLHVAGFILSGAILFGMTARGFGQKPLWRNILVGFALAFVIYGIFDRLLKLNLPGGPLELLIFRG